MGETAKVLPFEATPATKAFVSVRAEDVLLVDDMMEDTPDWTLGCGLPRRRPCGCIAILRGSAKPVRMSHDREEILKAVDPEGARFVTFRYVDPDGRTG